MDKIFDRLFVEFLIPAFLMLLCGLLLLQLVSGAQFDLAKTESRALFFGNNAFVIGGILFAYLVNTSLSALLNLVSRILLWGKTREYLMYRKLDVFKMPVVKQRIDRRLQACKRAKGRMKQLGMKKEADGSVKITWVGYIQHSKRLKSVIEHQVQIRTARCTPSCLKSSLPEGFPDRRHLRCWMCMKWSGLSSWHLMTVRSSAGFSTTGHKCGLRAAR